LWTFDVTGSTLAAPATQIPVTGGGNATPALAMTSGGSLLMAYPGGTLLRWNGAALDSVSIAAGLSSVVVSSDSTQAWAAARTHPARRPPAGPRQDGARPGAVDAGADRQPLARPARRRRSRLPAPRHRSRRGDGDGLGATPGAAGRDRGGAGRRLGLRRRARR